MTWIGRKKIAFVPLFRTNAIPPDVIPADWKGDILRRVLFDPDANTGADRSLRTYIRTASSGRADLDAVVMPMATTDIQDVRLELLDDLLDGPGLRAQGFDAAAIVMLGGVGAGTAQRGGFWARFVMAEKLGTWAMELMHVLTGFADIRCQPAFVDFPNGLGDIGNFDEMAFNGGMHPSAYTKSAIQWLDASDIAMHTGRAAGYELHAVGLVQPPPPGRSTAVRIGSQVPYLMVEARLMVDQFESPSQLESGIPSQGVIVYRVQTSDTLGSAQNNRIPVFLLTPTALNVGVAFTSDTNVAVSVTGRTPGGFLVVVDDRNAPPAWNGPADLTTVNNIVSVAGHFSTGDQRHLVVVGAAHGKVHEIFWKPAQQGIEGENDLPVDFGAGTIVSVAALHNSDQQRHVVLVGKTDGQVHEIFWKADTVGIEGHDDLPVPFAPGSIVAVSGLYNNSDQRHVVVVGTTAGRVHEIFWKADTVGIEGHDDLPVPFAPGSIVALTAFYNTDQQRLIVVVGTSAGKLHEIFWKSDTVGIEGHNDVPVSFDSGSIVAVSGFYDSNTQRHVVAVGTTDGKVHQVYWKADTVGIEAHGMVTQFSANSIVSLAGFYSASDQIEHIVVGLANGRLCELWVKPDLTA